MTPAETRLWEQLRSNRLDSLHFRRQQVVRGFILDFYCHAMGAVIEVDGDVHATQRAEDAQRDAVMQAEGLRVLRISNGEVMEQLEETLERIRRFCLETP